MLRDTYTGGRGALAPSPPLWVFSLTNCSDWCLSLVSFPFNPFWLAEALKNYILWTLDLLKHSSKFFKLWHSALIFFFTLYCWSFCAVCTMSKCQNVKMPKCQTIDKHKPANATCHNGSQNAKDQNEGAPVSSRRTASSMKLL